MVSTFLFLVATIALLITKLIKKKLNVMSESSVNQIPLGINFLYYMQAQKNGNKSNLVYTNSRLGV